VIDGDVHSSDDEEGIDAKFPDKEVADAKTIFQREK
jgi:hypothetical protein